MSVTSIFTQHIVLRGYSRYVINQSNYSFRPTRPYIISRHAPRYYAASALKSYYEMDEGKLLLHKVILH